MCNCGRGGGFSSTRHIAAQQLALRAANSRGSSVSAVTSATSVRSVRSSVTANTRAATKAPVAAAAKPAAVKTSAAAAAAATVTKTVPQFTKYTAPLARMVLTKAPRFLGLPKPQSKLRRR